MEPSTSEDPAGGGQGLSLSFQEKLATQKLELSGGLKKIFFKYLLRVGHVPSSISGALTCHVSLSPPVIP